MPNKLATFTHNGKLWTVDPRLQEFRHIVYGEMLEFVPFDSEQGEELMLEVVGKSDIEAY